MVEETELVNLLDDLVAIFFAFLLYHHWMSGAEVDINEVRKALDHLRERFYNVFQPLPPV
ncbi:MAG: hypothetical protein DDT26_02499 [Dehalococcoidia bacterium]|nr:hypothetical protein [Chloroflexota bacterium]